MKISYNWLKDFVDLKKLPSDKLASLMTMNFAEVDGMENVGKDFVIDLKILPDRSSDCLSHFGVAREIAVLAGSKMRDKVLKIKIKESKKEKIEDIMEVENRNPEICKRYVSRVILNVKIGPAPEWLVERLEAIGQKSINNIVDATNYVMFELGQPLHAFDLDKVRGGHKNAKIIIRKAKDKEKITTLDNQEVGLSKDILVIADAKDALAIAGVKGGKKAEIDDNTKNIVLESANFSAGTIRKASRMTNIRTESSIRFAADLDPNLAGIAMDRLASLIVQIAGGEVVRGVIDIYPRKVADYKVGFSVADVKKMLGVEISEKEIVDILSRFDFKVKKINPLKEILKLAPSLAGQPYKYGSSVSFDAPERFDCSSFTSYVFMQSGVQIPRISIDQYFFGDVVAQQDAKSGDLVFSSSGKGKVYRESQEFLKGAKLKDGIDHVGLYLGDGKVIHATGRKGKIVIENLKRSESFKNFRGFVRINDAQKDAFFVVNVPTYRRDIKRKADIVEEIGRVYGYQQNLISKLPSSILIPAKRNDELFWEGAAKDILVSAGFSEVYNYSFVGEKDLTIAGSDKGNVLSLQNYLSDDRKYLRPNLSFGFLKNAKDNLRNSNEVRLFEIGKIFSGVYDDMTEKKYLGGVIVKKSSQSKAMEFYEAKASVDLLLGKMGITEFWYDDFKPMPDYSEKMMWHALRTAEIKIGDEKIGIIGEVSPKITNAYEIDGRVAIFEIDFEKLARLASEEYVYRPISKFPAMERDLAILTPLNVKVDEVLNVLENVGGGLLVDSDLFDIYEGDNIDQGMKSLAFHLIFQSPDRTLVDSEVEEVMNKIIGSINERGWGARI